MFDVISLGIFSLIDVLDSIFFVKIVCVICLQNKSQPSKPFLSPWSQAHRPRKVNELCQKEKSSCAVD